MSQVDVDSSSQSDRANLAAYKLAVHFSEDKDLPLRFRKSAAESSKNRKVNEDSDIETRFRSNVEAWKELIEGMLARIEREQAWRFINLCPKATPGIMSVAESKEFRDFNDYLTRRRDREHCNTSELGNLALLSVAFQRQIEKQMRG